MQSLSHLDVVSGKARAQVLRDNMESQLYYRPTDVATARSIEERLGRRSAYARSTTERQHGQASESHAEQAIPLMTSQDIQRLHDDEVIGFHRALPPFELERMDWRQYPMLQKRWSLPVLELPTLEPLADLPVPHDIDRATYKDPDSLSTRHDV